ncbi:MAG: substrate-binding domain-containing protein [Geminicoccaceae bacterium]
MLALKTEVDSQISDHESLRAGSFWVGYSTYQIAMPPIARFIRTYPEITLTARAMASLDLVPMLRAGELDVAFVTARTAFEDLFNLEVASFRIGIIARADGALAKVDRLAWSDIAGLPLIQREPNAGTRRIFEAAAREAGIEVRTILGLGSWGSITSLVREGIGVGVGSEAEMTTADHDLKFIPMKDKSLDAHQFLVAVPAMAESVIVRQFIEIATKTRA